MPKYESSVDLEMPCSSVYNQWTQFEDFPMFMEGVESVKQMGEEMLHWCASIGGVRREWETRITQQIPDTLIAWEGTDGPWVAGEVRFESLDPTRTRVFLSMDYAPETLTEKAGDILGIVRRRVEGDLENFKRFLEERGSETGEWRGQIEDGRTVRLDEEASRKVTLDDARPEHAIYPTSGSATPPPPVTRPPTHER